MVTYACTSSTLGTKEGNHGVEASPDYKAKPCLNISNKNKVTCVNPSQSNQSQEVGEMDLTHAYQTLNSFLWSSHSRSLKQEVELTPSSLTLLYRGTPTFRHKDPGSVHLCASVMRVSALIY